MDPYATIDRIIEAVKNGFPDDAHEALDDLIAWAERGGFVPSPKF